MAGDVMCIIRVPGATAYTIGAAIVDLFHDHQLHRAVYLEAKYYSLYQATSASPTNYTTKLKELANAPRDLGRPVPEPS